MPRVFLCHCSKDKPAVRAIATRLRNAGVDVWLDEFELLAGQSLVGTIGKAIDSSDFVVVVLSEHALKSKWVATELGSAQHRELETGDTVVIPLLLADLKPPSLLRDKLQVRYFPKGARAKAFQQLLRAVHLLPKATAVHEKPTLSMRAVSVRYEVTSVHGPRLVVKKTSSYIPVNELLSRHQYRPGLFYEHEEVNRYLSTTIRVYRVSDGALLAEQTPSLHPHLDRNVMTRYLEVTPDLSPLLDLPPQGREPVSVLRVEWEEQITFDSNARDQIVSYCPVDGMEITFDQTRYPILAVRLEDDPRFVSSAQGALLIWRYGGRLHPRQHVVMRWTPRSGDASQETPST